MTDGPKVVSLHGGEPPLNGEPDDEIIRQLEWLLADAKSGQIQAIAFCAMANPDVYRVWFKCQPPMANALIGGASRMSFKLEHAVESLE